MLGTGILGFHLPTYLALCFLHWGECRDEAHARLSQLQDKAKKDLALYELESKELNRILEHDRKVNDFITIKLQERTLTEEALKAKEKHGMLGARMQGGILSDSRET